MDIRIRYNRLLSLQRPLIHVQAWVGGLFFCPIVPRIVPRQPIDGVNTLFYAGSSPACGTSSRILDFSRVLYFCQCLCGFAGFIYDSFIFIFETKSPNLTLKCATKCATVVIQIFVRVSCKYRAGIVRVKSESRLDGVARMAQFTSRGSQSDRSIPSQILFSCLPGRGDRPVSEWCLSSSRRPS